MVTTRCFQLGFRLWLTCLLRFLLKARHLELIGLKTITHLVNYALCSVSRSAEGFPEGYDTAASEALPLLQSRKQLDVCRSPHSDGLAINWLRSRRFVGYPLEW
jgi:hypothetical protein